MQELRTRDLGLKKQHDKLMKSHSLRRRVTLRFLVLRLMKQRSRLEKESVHYGRRLIAEQQSEAERWCFKTITGLSHINWKEITKFG